MEDASISGPKRAEGRPRPPKGTNGTALTTEAPSDRAETLKDAKKGQVAEIKSRKRAASSPDADASLLTTRGRDPSSETPISVKFFSAIPSGQTLRVEIFSRATLSDNEHLPALDSGSLDSPLPEHMDTGKRSKPVGYSPGAARRSVIAQLPSTS